MSLCAANPYLPSEYAQLRSTSLRTKDLCRNAQLSKAHIFDADVVSDLMSFHDQELRLRPLLETWKQSALELAEEPEEDDRDGFEVH
jgi:hypothetical protein